MRFTFQNQTFTAAILITILTLSIWWLGAPGWIAYLLSINLICFGFYGWDKWRAIQQKSRTPEGALHVMALAGGVLGAWAGQKTFRHKTLKRSFQWIFWSIAILQVLAILSWFYLKYQ
ncbi:MAG: DUF1294 domain-containing protein [Verrucomicrobia bacterium]|jgi:uncharacterized membrane protein YsdA (DUF1294 family)|nr:DUF1294 domain-containing protein [Verrucomicrobiota bacterium]